VAEDVDQEDARLWEDPSLLEEGDCLASWSSGGDMK